MITFNKAMEIVENNDAFYYKDEEHKGRKFRIFNYRLATYSDFNNDIDSLELRGLTFELNSKGTKKPYLGLHKFFNDGENPFAMVEWDENDVLDVREKLDGSFIQVFYIGKDLYVKTKGTFKSKQALAAEEFILKNQNYIAFILKCKKYNLQPFFEYVSPFNQIVIPYEKSELILTQIRTKDGEYLDYKRLKEFAEKFGLKIAKEYNYTLKKLRELQNSEKGFEGWVARNKKYPLKTQFRKVKTIDYFEKHHLLTGNAMQENVIIASILNENIDDIISTLPVNTEKRNYLEEIRNKVSHHYDKMVVELSKLLIYKKFNDRKDFALKHKNHPYFGVLMKARDEIEIENMLKEVILKRTQKLLNAKEFLKNI